MINTEASVLNLSGQPTAWLYRCRKPGEIMIYASVDANDTRHWPVDQWTEIKVEPLYLADDAP